MEITTPTPSPTDDIYKGNNKDNKDNNKGLYIVAITLLLTTIVLRLI